MDMRKWRSIMRKAIVVVDMQNDFIDGVLGTAEAQEMSRGTAE